MTFWFVTLIAGFVFQMLSTGLLSIAGIFPNLLLLATIFFSLRAGSVAGEWVGFFWGLLADVASTSILGSQTFMFTLIGYMVGRLHGKIDEDKPAAQMVIVLAMSIFYVLGLAFFENFFSGSAERFKGIASIFEPIYTTLISPIVFWCLAQWCAFFRLFRLKGIPQ